MNKRRSLYFFSALASLYLTNSTAKAFPAIIVREGVANDHSLPVVLEGTEPPRDFFQSAAEAELATYLTRLIPQIRTSKDADTRRAGLGEISLALARLGREQMALQTAPDADIRAQATQLLAFRRVIAGKENEVPALIEKLPPKLYRASVQYLLGRTLWAWHGQNAEARKWLLAAHQSGNSSDRGQSTPAYNPFSPTIAISLAQAGGRAEAKRILDRYDVIWEALQKQRERGEEGDKGEAWAAIIYLGTLDARAQAGLYDELEALTKKHPDLTGFVALALLKNQQYEKAYALLEPRKKEEFVGVLLAALEDSTVRSDMDRAQEGDVRAKVDTLLAKIKEIWPQVLKNSEDYQDNLNSYAETLIHQGKATEALEFVRRYGNKFDEERIQKTISDSSQVLQNLDPQEAKRRVDAKLNQLRTQMLHPPKAPFYDPNRFPIIEACREMFFYAWANNRNAEAREALLEAQKHTAEAVKRGLDQPMLLFAARWFDLGEPARGQALVDEVLRLSKASIDFQIDALMMDGLNSQALRLIGRYPRYAYKTKDAVSKLKIGGQDTSRTIIGEEGNRSSGLKVIPVGAPPPELLRLPTPLMRAYAFNAWAERMVPVDNVQIRPKLKLNNSAT